MLALQDVSYTHANGDLLFDHVHFHIHRHEKIALIGANGTGKSTLLRIMAGLLPPVSGVVRTDAAPYYIPQAFGQFDSLTIAGALKIDKKLHALQEILEGRGTEADLLTLDDDWTVETRCREALAGWGLSHQELRQPLKSLSGGEKTRVFLAGIAVHQPELILLDEPSNHLDGAARALLRDYISSTDDTLVMVSHDRSLLALPQTVCELNKQGLTTYGGNYDFYAAQKELENEALDQHIHDKERMLRKAREKERETMERQQKSDARGKAKQEKAGVARIMMNTLRNHAENSTSKTKTRHAEKIGQLSGELQELRAALPEPDKMKFGFDRSSLHRGKVLFAAERMEFSYGNKPLWTTPLDIRILSGERIALSGANGSGKTTLIRLVLGDLAPASGSVYRALSGAVCIDQDYSLVDNRRTVYGQARHFNSSGIPEHEVKTRLSRFLFPKKDWDKPCGALSGGERMRLLLCCLTITSRSPDLIVLDEPTNNLDIQNTDILAAAVNAYEGTLLVVSHDEHFLSRIRIDRKISL